MDPVTALSVAAAAAQFAEQGAEVYFGLLKYFKSVAHAPERSVELQTEALLISTVLKELKSTLKDIKYHSDEPLNDLVADFSKTMSELESRLVVIEDNEWIKRLKWYFTEKKINEYLSKFKKYRETFAMALSIIQRYIIWNFSEF